jgi:hypothetical protein
VLINNQCSLLIVILKLNKYKGLIMEFEKLDTRLEMQAVFLPDGTVVDSDLELENCQHHCTVSYECGSLSCSG